MEVIYNFLEYFVPLFFLHIYIYIFISIYLHIYVNICIYIYIYFHYTTSPMYYRFNEFDIDECDGVTDNYSYLVLYPKNNLPIKFLLNAAS